MFRKLTKNKKAQNTAEYALLIALVVAAVIAMQTYAQRSLQSRIRGASDYMATHAGNMTYKDSSGALQAGYDTKQYEPYYLKQNYNIERDSLRTADSYVVGSGEDAKKHEEWAEDTTRKRRLGGYQESGYNADMVDKEMDDLFN
ncbi:MAG: hypothetical protein GY861_23880 [bacterium]|nr:hypothetical protein [bacterium]